MGPLVGSVFDCCDGSTGCCVGGIKTGAALGLDVGFRIGATLGLELGGWVGRTVGLRVGCSVGRRVGTEE